MEDFSLLSVFLRGSRRVEKQSAHVTLLIVAICLVSLLMWIISMKWGSTVDVQETICELKREFEIANVLSCNFRT